MTAQEILQQLKKPVDTKGLQEPVKLKIALEYFSDKFGGRLPILIDREAFAAEPGVESVSPYEEEVVLPPVPSKMPMNTALRLILSQVAKGQATFVIRQSHIEIVPEKHATPAYLLAQSTMVAHLEKRPLAEVLQQLSDDAGIDIQLDPEAGKKPGLTISATFRNSSVGDALVTVTEMTQLKYVVLHRSIYVTTAAHAKALEQEEKIRREKREKTPLPKMKKLEGAAE